MNCTTAGSNINCTSTTTDYGAQQQRDYEAGQQVGRAIGSGVAVAIQRHSFNKSVQRYCSKHPGQNWSSGSGETGYCPSDSDKIAEATLAFMARHRDYIPDGVYFGGPNHQHMIAYLDTHRLDPRREKSYERAYRDLKQSGQLQLYAR
jgi:hypothetical protein